MCTSSKIEKKKIEKLEQEISALKEEISTLRKSEEKYKNIFETLPVSILVADEKGMVVEVNPFHIEHIGKGYTQAGDYLNHDIATRTSIIQAGLSEKYQSVLEGETIDEKEVYFPITTGCTDAYFNVKGTPIKRNEEIIGAIFITEDVTNLRKIREELIKHQEKLEELVDIRTKDLIEAYVDLQKENIERKKAEKDKEKLIYELQEALTKVKTLSGFIPICSSCKKIRDDKGFWNQLELYLIEHSEAEFSHSICPDCIKKLYPGLYHDKK